MHVTRTRPVLLYPRNNTSLLHCQMGLTSYSRSISLLALSTSLVGAAILNITSRTSGLHSHALSEQDVLPEDWQTVTATDTDYEYRRVYSRTVHRNVTESVDALAHTSESIDHLVNGSLDKLDLMNCFKSTNPTKPPQNMTITW